MKINPVHFHLSKQVLPLIVSLLGVSAMTGCSLFPKDALQTASKPMKVVQVVPHDVPVMWTQVSAKEQAESVEQTRRSFQQSLNQSTKKMRKSITVNSSNDVNTKDTPTRVDSPVAIYSLQRQWLAKFKDPVLNQYATLLLQHNPDLKVLAGQLDIADAQTELADASDSANTNLSLSTGRAGNAKNTSKSGGRFGVNLSSSWEIDVWGRLKASQDPSVYKHFSAEQDLVGAENSLVAQLAKQYFYVIEAKQQLKIVEQTVENLKYTLKVTRAFKQEGFAEPSDVFTVENSMASMENQLKVAQSNVTQLRQNLAQLVGLYADNQLHIPAQFPVLPPAPPLTLPSEVLAHRADMQAVTARLNAAISDSYSATVAKLPTFTLTGSVGSNTSVLKQLFDPVNVLWNVAGGITAPVFNRTSLDVNEKMKWASQHIAFANYQKTAINAINEVEKSLALGKTLAGRKVALTLALQSATKAEAVGEAKFKEGQVELLNLLQLKRATITAKTSLVSLEREMREQRVNLYLSLGGHF